MWHFVKTVKPISAGGVQIHQLIFVTTEVHRRKTACIAVNIRKGNKHDYTNGPESLV
jgi:hypothetical protein